jgi:hypothetical protein
LKFGARDFSDSENQSESTIKIKTKSADRSPLLNHGEFLNQTNLIWRLLKRTKRTKRS